MSPTRLMLQRNLSRAGVSTGMEGNTSKPSRKRKCWGRNCQPTRWAPGAALGQPLLPQPQFPPLYMGSDSAGLAETA
jgi:hypothetical protein